ncbi:MAG TPA: hypothetical protein VH206_01850 [Xanthobacteraceae bacterium]|jgi:hypothetical protein|nr:hypothetical protein [Xanthobacteraceae bacterium]
MSDGERVEQMMSDWLERKYPNGPTWYGRDATEMPPLEIRMIPAFGAVEYNLSNGGWAQFLWNCFDEWRAIIPDAKQGYLLIGAPEQCAALDTLWALCEHDERECGETHERANAAFRKNGQDAWSEIFGKFTSRSYSAPSNDWENLFWDEALYEKRWAWLAANEARVLEAMKFRASRIRPVRSD